MKRCLWLRRAVVPLLALATLSGQRLSVVAARSDSIEIFGPSLTERYTIPSTAFDVKHSPDGTLAAVSRPVDQSIDFYDLRGARPILSPPSLIDAANTIEFSTEGTCLIAVIPGGIASFSVDTRSRASRINTGFDVTSITVATPDRILVGDGREKRLVVFQIDSATCDLTRVDRAVSISGRASSDPVQIVASPDGKQVVAVNRSAGLDIFSMRDTNITYAATVRYPEGLRGYSAAYLPDASRIYVHASASLWMLVKDQNGRWSDSGVRIPVPGGRTLGAVGTQQIISDGKLVYFTARDSIGAANVATNRIVAQVPAGTSPVSMDLSGQLKTTEGRDK